MVNQSVIVKVGYSFCIYGFGLGGGGLDGAFFWGIIWDDLPSDGDSV